MSRFTPDFLIPENRGSLTRPACQRCRHRKDCPCSCDRVFERSLRRAASQGQTAAKLLMAEGERLLEAISCADDVYGLLGADEAAEYTLSNILHAEITLIKSLSIL